MATKKKKIDYDEDEPQGEVTVVTDFLPPPHELVRPGEMTVKITMKLDPETVKIFKKLADENNTKYQRMMREVLKGYAKKYEDKAS